MTKTETKIRSFRKLPDGWHYGTGTAPTDKIVAKALLYLSFFALLDLSKTDAFPGVDGEIMVTAYSGDHCLEITVELDGTFRFAHEIGDDVEVYGEHLSGMQVAEKLAVASTKMQLAKWNSCESLTHATTTTTSAVSSRIWHSVPNWGATVYQEYPASGMNAPMIQVDRSVPTSANFTTPLPLIPQFSGSSIRPLSRKIAA